MEYEDHTLHILFENMLELGKWSAFGVDLQVIVQDAVILVQIAVVPVKLLPWMVVGV